MSQKHVLHSLSLTIHLSKSLNAIQSTHPIIRLMMYPMSVLLVIDMDSQLISQPVKSVSGQPVHPSTVSIFSSSFRISCTYHRVSYLYIFAACIIVVPVRTVKVPPMPFVWFLVVKTDAVFSQINICVIVHVFLPLACPHRYPHDFVQPIQHCSLHISISSPSSRISCAISDNALI